MTIKFKITHEDLAAFYRFHYGRRLSNKVTAVLSVFVSDPLHRKIGMAIVVTVLSVVTIFIVPFSEAIRLWAVKRMYKAGDTFALGEHQIDLEGSDLITRSACFESRLPVSAIRQIEETKGYVYFYLTTNSAIVVPTDTVLAGEPARFVARLKEVWQEAFQLSQDTKTA
jgi:hypothetical protein